MSPRPVATEMRIMTRVRIMSVAPATLALSLALSACTVGPNFHRPEAKAPAAWGSQAVAPSTATAAEVDETWWNSFADPELSSLIAWAVTQNLDLAASAERIQQARAQRRVTRAAGLPQLGVSGQYAHERRSPDGNISLFEP